METWIEAAEGDRSLKVVLGVDPGLRCTGYAVLELAEGGPHLREGGEVRTLNRLSLETRLGEIFRQLEQVLYEFQPGAVSVEDLYTSYRNPQTAVLMGHARGVCLLAAAQAGALVYSYSPARIKKAITGTGRAGKAQVQEMVCSTLSLSASISEHVADAAAAALCHLNCYTVEDNLPGGISRLSRWRRGSLLKGLPHESVEP